MVAATDKADVCYTYCPSECVIDTDPRLRLGRWQDPTSSISSFCLCSVTSKSKSASFQGSFASCKCHALHPVLAIIPARVVVGQPPSSFRSTHDKSWQPPSRRLCSWSTSTASKYAKRTARYSLTHGDKSNRTGRATTRRSLPSHST